jgi:small subunit ribosomal protein S4e
LKIKKRSVGPKGVPFVVSHDGRTLRYPDPAVDVNDTVKLDLESGKILEFIKFEPGNKCMIIGGKNVGRVGVVESREKHPGGFDIVHIKDARNHKFATRSSNVFVIGKGNNSLVKLPLGGGIRLSVIEQRDKHLSEKK